MSGLIIDPYRFAGGGGGGGGGGSGEVAIVSFGAPGSTMAGNTNHWAWDLRVGDDDLLVQQLRLFTHAANGEVLQAVRLWNVLTEGKIDDVAITGVIDEWVAVNATAQHRLYAGEDYRISFRVADASGRDVERNHADIVMGAGVSYVASWFSGSDTYPSTTASMDVRANADIAYEVDSAAPAHRRGIIGQRGSPTTFATANRVGWSFTPNADFTVNRLRVLNSIGETPGENVRLHRDSDGALLAEATITAPGTGLWAEAAVSDVNLVSGVTYVISTKTPTSRTTRYNPTTRINSPSITFVEGRVGFDANEPTTVTSSKYSCVDFGYA